MRGVRLIVLIIVVLVGALIALRVHQLRRREAANPIRPIVNAGMINRAPILPDGSFNPIPPVKASPQDDISTHAATLDWRPVTMPLLAQVRPTSSTGSRLSAEDAHEDQFYIYPCLDRTPVGVGMHFTYGWRLTASAMLGHMTTLRLGSREPAHLGLPELNQERLVPVPTIQDWNRMALEDPATAAARYIINAAFIFDAKKSTCILQTWLIDRRKPAEQKNLATVVDIPAADFGRMANAQRALASAIVETLVSMGLANRRPLPEIQDFKLDTQLAGVACLFNLGDSWSLMEGIDRALALAALFPNESAPLQAAAYGLMQRYWAYGTYASYVTSARMDALKAWALCQLALAIEPRPEMTRITWAYACGVAGHVVAQRLKDAEAEAPVPALQAPEMDHYLNQALEIPERIDLPLATQMLPEWSKLWLEQIQSRKGQTGPLRDFFIDRVQFWSTRDLYLAALLHGCEAHYQTEGMQGPDSRATASRYASQGTLAAEAASIMVALGDSTRTAALAGRIAALTGLKAGELIPLARDGKFYPLRFAILRAINSWPAPAKEDHPFYALLGELEPLRRAIAEDPKFSVACTGYDLFENTPAERVRFAAGLDHLGPLFLAEYEGLERKSGDEALAIIQAYLRRRPANPAAQYNLIRILDVFPQIKDSAALTTASARAALQLFPFEPDPLYFVAGCFWRAGDRERAENCFQGLVRTDPFNAYLDQRLGEFYYQAGHYARAAKYLGGFVAAMPDRHDADIKRAWALCQLGQWNQEGVREAFVKAIASNPANPQYHEDYLNYLFNWAADMKAARRAARDYQARLPTLAEPYAWEAEVDNTEGNPKQGLEILKKATGAGLTGPSLVHYHLRMAESYMTLGQPQSAAPHVADAAKLAPGQANVLIARGDLALAVGDTTASLAAYRECAGRYGVSPGLILKTARVLGAQGNKLEALALLEQTLFEKGEPDLALAMEALTLCAELNKPEKMGNLLKIILRSPQRNRESILTAAGIIQKFDPKLSEEMRTKIDQILE